MQKFLNCFYDLAVSPAYFDFITYLEIAELHRIRRGFDKIRIIFIPGPKNGFRNDTLRSTENNRLMMRNVLLPACHLIPTCESVMWFDQRGSAAGILQDTESVFPRDYTLQQPISDYSEVAIQCAFLRDEVIGYLTAPLDKQKMAQAYLNSVAQGKKALTVTLREAEHDASPRRRIDVPQWEKFFDTLDLSQYQPIIVRDTAHTFATDDVFHDYPHAQLASIDTSFRMALYENAHMNFFVNNGPYTLALYSKSNSVVFKYADEQVHSTSNNFLKTHLGIYEGVQRPIAEKRSVICWEDDTEENIRREFDSMESNIQTNNLDEQHNIGSTEQAMTTIATALAYTFKKMNFSVHQEDLQVLLRIQQYHEILNQSPQWNFNLAHEIVLAEGNRVPEGTLDKIRQLEATLNLGLTLS